MTLRNDYSSLYFHCVSGFPVSSKTWYYLNFVPFLDIKDSLIAFLENLPSYSESVFLSHISCSFRELSLHIS